MILVSFLNGHRQSGVQCKQSFLSFETRAWCTQTLVLSIGTNQVDGELESKQFGGIGKKSTTEVEMIHRLYEATDKFDTYVQVVKVKIGNEYSHSGRPNGGVSQGTLSAPKCFLVYINDLKTPVPLYKYVDNSMLFKVCDRKGVSVIQESVDIIAR